MNELQYRQEQLELLNSNLLRQVDRLKEEKEEREKEAVSYYNALEVLGLRYHLLFQFIINCFLANLISIG